MKSQLRLPFYLALKYLQRGRKWTLILTLFLMAIAFINLIFVSSLFNGIMIGTDQQVINTMTGNLYMAPKEGSEFIKDVNSSLDKIRSINGVKAVGTETQVPGRLQYEKISGNWQTLAINPEQYAKVINIANNITTGKYLEADDEDGILIGHQLAGGKNVEQNAFSFKGAKVGEKVNLIINNQPHQFTIRGIFKTKFMYTDQRAFVTRTALQKIIPDINGNATMIVIKTNQDANETKIISSVRDQNIDADVYTWKEAAGLMKSVSESFVSINALLTVVGILIAAVTIFIVIYIDIVNKRKEIGILQAIGIRPYIIIFSYVILSAVYAILGVLLGTAIFNFIIVPYFETHPFVLPIVDAVLILDKIDYIARAEAVIWVAIFSGLIPAAIITKAKMIDAILGR